MDNMKKKVFIDGSAGTTGLRIKDRLSARNDIELVLLPDEIRKDPDARMDAISSSDICFLCLPDDASREIISIAGDVDTVIIDTSTAHRTADGWTYGFPELGAGAKRGEIAGSLRIANPGCHASGFIALVAPLVERGILSEEAALSCFSVTGYSGGGKKMIADYEMPERAAELAAPRQYALGQQHKHLREMQVRTGLKTAPIFSPIVADFYSGMEVSVPVFARDLNGSADDVREIFASYYRDGLVRFCEHIDDGGFISACAMSGRDDMLVTVDGNDERLILTALFDNLGKGASGAAIQNMNIVMGKDEATGLVTAG